MSAAMLQEALAGARKPTGDAGVRRPQRGRRTGQPHQHARGPAPALEEDKDDAIAISLFATSFSRRTMDSATYAVAEEEDDEPHTIDRELDNEEETMFAQMVAEQEGIDGGELRALKDRARLALGAALSEAAVFAWEDMGCDDSEAPAWGDIGGQENSCSTVPKLAAAATPPLPAVAWESLGNDADDLLEFCVRQQEEEPAGVAWESLGNDGEEAPSWDELGTEDNWWVPRGETEAASTAVRLPGVAWESLGNDADDLWESCVAQQDLAPIESDPYDSDFMEDGPDASMLTFHCGHFEEAKDPAPAEAGAGDEDPELLEVSTSMLTFHCEHFEEVRAEAARAAALEAAKAAAPPTPSRTRRRIFRDTPALSPKAVPAEALAGASPAPSSMSMRSRQKLTGSCSLPSLRTGLKFSSLDLQDSATEADSWRPMALFAAPPATAQPSWLSAAPASEGSAMARDLGLPAGPLSSPSRAPRALLPSGSQGLLPQLSSSPLGAKGRAKFTQVQAAGQRNRLWDLDSTFVVR